jgi:hypothetical protein
VRNFGDNLRLLVNCAIRSWAVTYSSASRIGDALRADVRAAGDCGRDRTNSLFCLARPVRHPRFTRAHYAVMCQEVLVARHELTDGHLRHELTDGHVLPVTVEG